MTGIGLLRSSLLFFIILLITIDQHGNRVAAIIPHEDDRDVLPFPNLFMSTDGSIVGHEDEEEYEEEEVQEEIVQEFPAPPDVTVSDEPQPHSPQDQIDEVVMPQEQETNTGTCDVASVCADFFALADQLNHEKSLLLKKVASLETTIAEPRNCFMSSEEVESEIKSLRANTTSLTLQVQNATTELHKSKEENSEYVKKYVELEAIEKSLRENVAEMSKKLEELTQYTKNLEEQHLLLNQSFTALERDLEARNATITQLEEKLSLTKNLHETQLKDLSTACLSKPMEDGEPSEELLEAFGKHGFDFNAMDLTLVLESARRARVVKISGIESSELPVPSLSEKGQGVNKVGSNNIEALEIPFDDAFMSGAMEQEVPVVPNTASTNCDCPCQTNKTMNHAEKTLDSKSQIDSGLLSAEDAILKSRSSEAGEVGVDIMAMIDQYKDKLSSCERNASTLAIKVKIAKNEQTALVLSHQNALLDKDVKIDELEVTCKKEVSTLKESVKTCNSQLDKSKRQSTSSCPKCTPCPPPQQQHVHKSGESREKHSQSDKGVKSVDSSKACSEENPSSASSDRSSRCANEDNNNDDSYSHRSTSTSIPFFLFDMVLLKESLKSLISSPTSNAMGSKILTELKTSLSYLMKAMSLVSSFAVNVYNTSILPALWYIIETSSSLYLNRIHPSVSLLFFDYIVPWYRVNLSSYVNVVVDAVMQFYFDHLEGFMMEYILPYVDLVLRKMYMIAYYVWSYYDSEDLHIRIYTTLYNMSSYIAVNMETVIDKVANLLANAGLMSSDNTSPHFIAPIIVYGICLFLLWSLRRFIVGLLSAITLVILSPLLLVLYITSKVFSALYHPFKGLFKTSKKKGGNKGGKNKMSSSASKQQSHGGLPPPPPPPSQTQTQTQSQTQTQPHTQTNSSLQHPVTSTSTTNLAYERVKAEAEYNNKAKKSTSATESSSSSSSSSHIQHSVSNVMNTPPPFPAVPPPHSANPSSHYSQPPPSNSNQNTKYDHPAAQQSSSMV